MQVVLQATSSGPRAQKVQLRANQVARIGRSEWADFSFGDDSSMADVQFELRSTAEACIVRNLSPDSPIYVNGAEIQSETVHNGDRIKAGQTEFVVHIEGERPPTPPDSSPQRQETFATQLTADARPALASLVVVCAFLEFHEEIGARAATLSSADQLIDELAEQEKFLDALRLRAYLLTKREAVWWGCLCVRDELDEPLRPTQAAAVKAAAIWVGKPDEDNRRAAEHQAAAAKYSGVGASLALSAFWSGGSLAPPENPEVLPDERLTSQGVAAALISGAYMGNSTKANDRIHAFLAKGKEVAAHKIPLPEEDVAW